MSTNGKPTVNADEIEKLLRSDDQKDVKKAMSMLDDQAQKALNELQMKMWDLVFQVLGFQPTNKDVEKYGKIEKSNTGRIIFYWGGEAFLKLSPIKAQPVVMRVGDKNQKIKFAQDYDILKDDPAGYKFRNPNDNYVVNNYGERDQDDDNLISS